MSRFNSKFLNNNKVDERKILPSEEPSEKQTHNIDSPDSETPEEENIIHEQGELLSVESDDKHHNPDKDDKLPIASSKEVDTNEITRDFQKINVDLIDFATNNPFRKNDSSRAGVEGIEELSKNIALFGLIHPLVVKEKDGRYILISGERRLRAVRLLGWKQVDCSVIKTQNEDLEKGMLHSANVEVRSISPFDMFSYIYELKEIYADLANKGEVKGDKYQYLADSLSITKRQLVKYTSIMNGLNLLTDDERNQLKNGDISLNKAYNLIKVRKKGLESENKSGNILENKTHDGESSANAEVEQKYELYTNDIDTKHLDDNISTSEKEKFSNNSVSENGVGTMSTIQQEVECKSQHKSDLHNEVKNVNGATLHENESALSIYKDLVDTLIAPEHASEIQMYEGISKTSGKRIYGILMISNEKEYIVFPSHIYSGLTTNPNVRNISFSTNEIQKGSARKRVRRQ